MTLKGKNIENLHNDCEHSVLPCPACLTVVCLPQHLIQMVGSLSGFSRARCWAHHLYQVRWSRETSQTCRAEGANRTRIEKKNKKNTDLSPTHIAGLPAEVIILFQQMRKPIIFMYWFNLLIKTVIIKPNIKLSEICRAGAAALPLTEKVMIWD